MKNLIDVLTIIMFLILIKYINRHSEVLINTMKSHSLEHQINIYNNIKSITISKLRNFTN